MFDLSSRCAAGLAMAMAMAAWSANGLAAVTEGPVLPTKLSASGGGGPTSALAIDDFQIQHRDGFKGAKRVAISVFNVAFPNDNVQSAKASETHSFGFLSAIGTKMTNTTTTTKKAYQHTILQGVDPATRQRIADAAYADFVQQLSGAGYEVLTTEELAALAPEYKTWTAEPNFKDGRFGAYVAPTGRSVYMLMGDTAKRDTSAKMDKLMLGFRAADRPQAYTRSPYLANTGKIGIIAVTLVIDYGTYMNTGDAKSVNTKMELGFNAGVTALGGSLLDSATLVEYWGPDSGGFPAVAALAAPLTSDLAVGAIDDGGNGDGEVIFKANAPLFEKAAQEVVRAANAKLVGALAAYR